jgi:hypothetical protein
MSRKKRFYWPRERPVIAELKPALIGDRASPKEPVWRPNEAEAVNSDLSGYKWTANPLFAWSILEQCIEAGQPLPSDVAVYFSKTAKKLLEFAKSTKKNDYKAVVKTVLGTNDGRDGVSVFEDYRLTQLQRRICEKVDRHLANTFGDAETNRAAKPATRTDVYEKVAKCVCKTPEYVKDVIENMERTAGGFSFRGVQEAIKSGTRELPTPAQARVGKIEKAK